MRRLRVLRQYPAVTECPVAETVRAVQGDRLERYVAYITEGGMSACVVWGWVPLGEKKDGNTGSYTNPDNGQEMTAAEAADHDGPVWEPEGYGLSENGRAFGALLIVHDTGLPEMQRDMVKARDEWERCGPLRLRLHGSYYFVTLAVTDWSLVGAQLPPLTHSDGVMHFPVVPPCAIAVESA